MVLMSPRSRLSARHRVFALWVLRHQEQWEQQQLREVQALFRHHQGLFQNPSLNLNNLHSLAALTPLILLIALRDQQHQHQQHQQHQQRVQAQDLPEVCTATICGA